MKNCLLELFTSEIGSLKFGMKQSRETTGRDLVTALRKKQPYIVEVDNACYIIPSDVIANSVIIITDTEQPPEHGEIKMGNVVNIFKNRDGGN